MGYGYKERSHAELACAAMSKTRANATNKYVVAPYETDADTVLSWTVEHWYKPFDDGEADWALNGPMFTARPVGETEPEREQGMDQDCDPVCFPPETQDA